MLVSHGLNTRQVMKQIVSRVWEILFNRHNNKAVL